MHARGLRGRRPHHLRPCRERGIPDSRGVGAWDLESLVDLDGTSLTRRITPADSCLSSRSPLSRTSSCFFSAREHLFAMSNRISPENLDVEFAAN